MEVMPWRLRCETSMLWRCIRAGIVPVSATDAISADVAPKEARARQLSARVWRCEKERQWQKRKLIKAGEWTSEGYWTKSCTNDGAMELLTFDCSFEVSPYQRFPGGTYNPAGIVRSYCQPPSFPRCAAP